MANTMPVPEHDKHFSLVDPSPPHLGQRLLPLPGNAISRHLPRYHGQNDQNGCIARTDAHSIIGA